MLSSTLGITVVVGFPIIASAGSPYASSPSPGVYLGLERSNLNRPRTGTRPSSIVSLSHTRKPLPRSLDRYRLLPQALTHDDTLPILYPEDNSLRPAKVKSDEESTEPIVIKHIQSRLSQVEALRKQLQEGFFEFTEAQATISSHRKPR